MIGLFVTVIQLTIKEPVRKVTVFSVLHKCKLRIICKRFVRLLKSFRINENVIRRKKFYFKKSTSGSMSEANAFLDKNEKKRKREFAQAKK